MSVQTFCFLEQTEFALRLVRCERSDRTLRVDSLQEFAIVDPQAPAALAALGATTGATLWCALRPKRQRVHLATADEAKRHPGAAGVIAALASSSPEAFGWLAAVDATTGGAFGADRWIALACSAEGHAEAIAPFAATALKPARCVSATLMTAGAVAATNSGPVLVLELGDTASFALVVDRAGVRGLTSVSVHRTAIAEAVQAELGLKFRGAADKLFFNPDYDFGDIAPAITTRVVAGLKAETAALLGELKPGALFCGTLGARQQWLTAQFVTALGLQPFKPDLKAWCAANGIHFATPALEAAASAGWLGTLHSLHAHTLATASPGPWQVEWRPRESAATAPAPAKAPAAVVAPEKPAVIAPPVAAPAPPPATAVKAKPLATVPEPKPAAKAPPAAAAKAPTPTTSIPTAPAKPIEAKKAATPPFPVVRPAEPARPAQPRSEPTPSSVSYPPKPVSPAKEPAKSVSKIPEAPASKPASAPRPNPATGDGGAASTPKPKRKLLVPVAIAVAAVLLLVVGLVVRSQRNAAELAAEKQKTELRLKAEQERAKLAEQKAQEEAEARAKTERELSEKLKLAESARAQAEKEVQSQTAARLANARGTVVIVTEPAGATITVGTLPPRTSPATFSDIKIGRYPVRVSLPGYDEAKLEVDVPENGTINPGTVALTRATGTLEISTDPAGVSFELKPANALIVSPDARRTGTTPARFDDLAPGAYAVTLTRDGWSPHTETVDVARAAVAKVQWGFPTGFVRVTSTPSGATVKRNGASIGTTPLELKEQPVGPVKFEITRPDFDQPLTVAGEVLGGKVLDLAAQFPTRDRIYAVGELENRPNRISGKDPELPYYLTLEKGRIEIEMVVLRDGSTKDYRVLSTTNPDYPKYCIEAVKQWRFRPATVDGQPVNARITLPMTFKATNG